MLASLEGLTPFPFSDIYLLLPTQILMIIALSKVYSIKREKTDIITWISSFSMSLILAYSGKIAASILKIIPIIGTCLGMVVNTGISALYTFFIGKVGIEFCEINFDFTKLKNWCIDAINNYILAITSFKTLSDHFAKKETTNENDYVYEFD